MSEESLTGRFVRHAFSPEGHQAEIVLVEANGDEHPVRCLCRPTNTEICGDPAMLDYLNQRYGDDTVEFVSRMTTLSDESEK